jgi:hypothetical protein
MTEDISFPITELTDDLFESEKVFHADYDWDGIHYIKEADIQSHYKRVLVDSEGYLLKITGGEIVKRPLTILKSIFPPTITVKFGLEKTNQRLTIQELRKIFLHRKSDIFHITDNNLMTVEEFEKRINSASTIKDLIEVATFEQEDLYD